MIKLGCAIGCVIVACALGGYIENTAIGFVPGYVYGGIGIFGGWFAGLFTMSWIRDERPELGRTTYSSVKF